VIPRHQLINSGGNTVTTDRETDSIGAARKFPRATSGGRTAMAIEGIRTPDSRLAREITELVQDTDSPLLFHHSSRVLYRGTLTDARRSLSFGAELLHACAMFHDMRLTHRHSSPNERFEVDGALAARDFLCGHGIAQEDVDTVWTAIALHIPAGIPQHMHPVVALVTAGVEMDVLGIASPEFTDAGARRSCGRIHAPSTSRIRPFKPSTTASGTNRTQPSATSRRTCSPTRIRISHVEILPRDPRLRLARVSVPQPRQQLRS
jgi:hypothetical protein